MQKQPRTLSCFFAGIAACILPFAAAPPLLSLLPEEALYAVTFALVYLLCPVLSVIVPYRIARRAIAPIAAWPWPLIGYLILPLYGIRPSFSVLFACALLALVSGVCGDEVRQNSEKAPRGRKAHTPGRQGRRSSQGGRRR